MLFGGFGDPAGTLTNLQQIHIFRQNVRQNAAELFLWAVLKDSRTASGRRLAHRLDFSAILYGFGCPFFQIVEGFVGRVRLVLASPSPPPFGIIFDPLGVN